MKKLITQVINTSFRTPTIQEIVFQTTNQPHHLRAIFIGVVRQEVKRSAGSSGFMGSSSLVPQAASCMQCLVENWDGLF